jgi:membrane associated rhomboid family serine protease
MIIPMGTDAPIYHWPKATVVVIILNIVLFFVVPAGSGMETGDEEGTAVAASLFDRFSLALGDGLHPVQWVTHNFLHFDLLHLAGNMLFLWTFGIVVEGKLGMRKFLAACLTLGTLHGACVQALMLGSSPVAHAAGASAIVYGLLAFCIVWAPRNELNCLVILIAFIRVFVFHWDIRYTTVALLYLGEQLLGLALGGLTGQAVVSELGHLSGAFWGLILATVMLKAGWVDCEGWDMFTLWAKRKQLAKDWKLRGERLERQNRPVKSKRKKEVEVDEEASIEDRSASALKRVRKLIEMGDYAGAVAAYDKSARSLVNWPTPADHLELIKAMHARKAEADSIPLLRDYCRKHAEVPPRIRLKLAQILIRVRQRPTEALRVLGALDLGSLPPDLETTRLKLEHQAVTMQEDGVLELEGDD